MILFHGSPKRIPETAHARCVRTAVRPTAIDVEDTGETKISPSYCGNAMDIWCVFFEKCYGICVVWKVWMQHDVAHSFKLDTVALESRGTLQAEKCGAEPSNK